MFDNITNCPLTWPVGWPRTVAGKRAQAAFKTRDSNYQQRRHSITEGVTFVLNELRLLSAMRPIISTNVQVRLDGLPKAGQAKPGDPGVAVYFAMGGQPRVLACDKWTTVEDNLWAIGLHIEAMRGQQRWGVGSIEQAFMGYEALPAPKSTWWEILGVEQSGDEETVRAAYRAHVKQAHPDSGGNGDAFIRVQGAWDQARKERGWRGGK